MDKPEKAEYNPVCPFCDREITHLISHESQAKSLLGLTSAKLGYYSCPNCRKFLGMASRAYGES